MKAENIKINYDKEYDVLYITFKTEASINTSENNGIYVMSSIKTGEITGLTIIGFVKKLDDIKCEKNEIQKIINKYK